MRSPRALDRGTQPLRASLVLVFGVALFLASCSTSGSASPPPSSTSSSVAAPTTTGPPTLFADTFKGTALSSSWDAVVGSNPSNGEQECYSSTHVSVRKGMLTETAVVGSVPANCHCPPGPTSVVCPYGSGAVQWASSGFTYGTVTVRAKLAAGVGTWPAIWLLGTECRASISTDVVGWIGSGANCPWPTPGANEIDIAEIQPAPIGNPSVVNQAVHTTDVSGAKVDEGCGYTCPSNAGGWHTYSLIWTPGSLTWMIDGTSTYSLTQDVPSTPMFLIINTAVGGTGVSVDDATLPQTTEISSVNVTGT
jgi:beta-glucanase (GH16 family)